MEALNVCENIQNPEGGRYVLFLDSFLSGWSSSLCPRQSYFALLVTGDDEAATVVTAGCRRSDFRLHHDDMSYTELVKLASVPGNHITVRDETLSSRFYEPDGFGESDE